jgi:uncharacterized membrane protein
VSPGPDTFPSWQVWALLSAVFAALTAIFAKIGVEDINSDLATLIRTVVLFSLALILFANGQFNRIGPISTKSWVFLVLSGLGTGASRRGVFGRTAVAQWLARHRHDRRRRGADRFQAVAAA